MGPIPLWIANITEYEYYETLLLNILAVER